MNVIDFTPVQTNTMPLKEKLLSLIWKMVNNTLFRYSPFFCRGWRRWLLKLFGAHVNEKASVNRLAVIDYPWNFSIGAYSSIGPGCWVYALNKISIGEKSCVGQDVKVLTGSHSVTDVNFSLQTAPVRIGSCCWISTSAIILPGVLLHDGVVVGAGAVVPKTVDPWKIVVGNPAKIIKHREMGLFEER